MARRKRKLVIKSAPQLRALRTPLRQQMVRALLEFGECTVRELADELGREPAALYYHVHALIEAGIATETGQRAGGGRPERIYSLVADRMVIDKSVTSGPFLAALADLNRATLRTAERELAASVRARTGGGPDDRTSLLRLAARLKPRDAARAAKMLHEVVEFLADHDDADAGDTYSLTVAFVRATK